MPRRHIAAGSLMIALGMLPVSQSSPEVSAAIAPVVRVFGGRSAAQRHRLRRHGRHQQGLRGNSELCNLCGV